MAAEASSASSPGANKTKVLRCMDWLQKQNNQEVKKSLQNKNDIQFIIQMNADRKNFLLSAAEDEATVPPGIEESTVEPKPVPVRRLRTDKLTLECDWQLCRQVFSDYNQFQKHVPEHSQDLHVIGNNEDDESVEYVCLWDVCGHKTADFKEMVRHINYHAYHTKLMAVGFNARATLKLLRCKKDSTKRNQLPPLKGDHCCMWTGCDQGFDSIQKFFDHVKLHTNYSEDFVCSWAGCGASFPRRIQLTVHVASHTRERQIACFHCGQHFANNRKLLDHLRRQNVNPNSPWACSMCGIKCATEYLLNEHSRMHVSAFACALCDMSAQTPAALAQHVRYRHMAAEDARTHSCPHCHYKAVTKGDLRKHIITHKRKRNKLDPDSEELTDEETVEPLAKKRPARKYACHLCPDKQMKVFSRGTKLTSHLVKVHGAQWPFGYSRFRYQVSEDGMYRLTTTRYEVLEVSKKIVDGYSGPKESLTNNLEFTIKKTSDATENTPTSFEIVLKGEEKKEDEVSEDNQVEIIMCDVDDKGNIIKSEVINSDAVFKSTNADTITTSSFDIVFEREKEKTVKHERKVKIKCE